MPDTILHHRTCNLCEAMCGLEIHVEDGEITTIKGDSNDPFSQGHICPKAVALKDIYTDPNRLKHPIKRTDAGWEEISWKKAIEEVASTLKKIQEKYGENSIGIYQGNPNVHNMGTMLTAPNFIKSIPTQNRFSATSVDQLPHHFAAHFMFGHPLLIPIPDIDRTDFMIIMGGNPLVSNGSMMTAPNYAHRMKAVQKRGGKIVVIDPRKTETADKADEHIFIHPGKDSLLLMAMIHVLFDENLIKLGHLAPICKNLEKVESAVAEFSPSIVSSALGIEAEKIRDLTRTFSKASSAVCYARMGVSTQEFGGLANWLVNLLNLLTGNIDRPGGGMFTQPAFDIVKQRGRKGKKRFNRWQSRVRGLPEFAGELPASAMIEEITTPGEGQIKAMVTIAGNPVLSTPNGNALDYAFEQLDFMVAIDIYLNETTRHANIILPPTTGLETDHYDVIFHTLAIRNTAKFSPALFEKREGQLHDWEIFNQLAAAMKENEANQMSPDQILEFAMGMGPYKKDGISFEALKKAVHGIDLGPLKPCLSERLLTEDGMINLAPSLLLEDIPRLKSLIMRQVSPTFPLTLIGRRHLRSNNSWMHNSQRLVKGRDRCTVLINPTDAIEHGIETGSQIEVTSRVGKIILKAEVTTEMMEGVVSIPHGWGHNKKGIRLNIAQKHAGESVNDLTDTTLLDELTGNAAVNGVPVKIALSRN